MIHIRKGYFIKIRKEPESPDSFGLLSGNWMYCSGTGGHVDFRW